MTKSKMAGSEVREEWTIFSQRRVRIVGLVFYKTRNAPAATSVPLWGVNKFLASGKPTNSDWGKVPQRLNAVIEAQILDRGRISELLALFREQRRAEPGTVTG